MTAETISHRIHGAGYANIGGIIMVNVTIYGSTMDPMALKPCPEPIFCISLCSRRQRACFHLNPYPCRCHWYHWLSIWPWQRSSMAPGQRLCIGWGSCSGVGYEAMGPSTARPCGHCDWGEDGNGQRCCWRTERCGDGSGVAEEWAIRNMDMSVTTP